SAARPCSSTSTTTTFAPSAANSRAVAAPMLPPPPEINATLSRSRSMPRGSVSHHHLESRVMRSETAAPAGLRANDAAAPDRTVRDATLDVMRTLGLTTIFSNPGSTEISFLVDLPDDLRFVLALHEGSVVGLATGYAIGRGEPAFALLHTTA